MPDSDQITTIPSKPRVSWWKKPWTWIAGGFIAVGLFFLIWRLKNQALSDQKALAKLRTAAQHQRLAATKREHEALLVNNDEQKIALRQEAMRLRAKADLEVKKIVEQEMETDARIEALDSITSWEQLDALNKVGRE